MSFDGRKLKVNTANSDRTGQGSSARLVESGEGKMQGGGERGTRREEMAGRGGRGDAGRGKGKAFVKGVEFAHTSEMVFSASPCHALLFFPRVSPSPCPFFAVIYRWK